MYYTVPTTPGNVAGHNYPKTNPVPSKHPFEFLSDIQNMTLSETPLLISGTQRYQAARCKIS
jgi:hypothetical protein